MKKTIALLTVLAISACSVIVGQIPLQLKPEQKLAQLKKAVTDNLENNILSYWSSKMPDG